MFPFIRKKKIRRQGVVNWSKRFVLSCFLGLFCYHSQASLTDPTASFKDSTETRKIRQLALISGASYALALYGLNELWYQDFPRSGFHFFNDNNEWKQLDKAGHFYSAFHLSNTGIHLLKKNGVEPQKAYFWGGMLGIIILTPIEILDGFSAEYGASWGDALANSTGAAFAMGQHLMWQEIRIKPKFSFASTYLAANRPQVLGDGIHEEILKDYNGQTYWLSVDLFAFHKKSTKFPKWLNLALGYGGENLIYASNKQNTSQGFEAYRQYYLALDLDLSHIKSPSKLVNTLLYIVDLIHLPAPALEYNRLGKWSFHPLKF